MLSVIFTRAAIGMEAPAVSVEVHLSRGLPALTLVGLPEKAVKEARERVRSAIINCGFTFPVKRTKVNLAPADLPKEGGRYDLAIAIAILAASEQIPVQSLSQYEFLGEITLSGALRGVRGVIPAINAANATGRQLILPAENSHEAGLLAESGTLISHHLQEVCAFLHRQNSLHPPAKRSRMTPPESDDLEDIIGQEQAKRALEITAAGGHNLLLMGPPGTGKTMLATRLIALLPPLTEAEAIENAAISSLSTSCSIPEIWHQRPFRTPHHSASRNALVGGGTLPKPGEISLAHNGVLFLDELPEFERKTPDALREPLESGEIYLARSQARIRYPARFQLIAAMNPSPMGHYDGQHSRASPRQVLRYLSRLSGPFLDRFDLSLEVPLLPPGTLSQTAREGEKSEVVRQRVILARQKQLARAGIINTSMTAKMIKKYCPLSQEDACWLEDTLNRLGLSVRAWHRLLKSPGLLLIWIMKNR
ncbi:MAG: Competence protein ComM [Candidatus Erwinia impunctatus]|nr:Competence protein ComM [Culicoides impunctatus]